MNQEIMYKKISELEKYNFIIPMYQRGYRWTKLNITQLFDDIYSENKDYYLQPLIVNNAVDGLGWNVVDGQQRLTTIFIMLSVLKFLFGSADTNSFTLSYESREQSKEFLNFLNNKLLDLVVPEETINEEIIWSLWQMEFNKNSNSAETAKKNLDFEYMMMAFCILLDKYKSHEKFAVNKKYFFEKLVSCKFVWYQMESKENENLKEQEIGQFSKINMGKIPLTNAELIKVEILNHKNFNREVLDVNYRELHNKQFAISDRWYFIEKELHKKDFWSFVPHINQYENNDFEMTRIDYILDFFLLEKTIEANISLTEDDNFNRSVEKYIEKINKEDPYDLYNRFVNLLKEMENKSEQIWGDIDEIFWNLVDLFENDGREIHYSGDNGLYNLLGYFMYYTNRYPTEYSYLYNYALFSKILRCDRNDRVDKVICEIKNVVFSGLDIKNKILRMRYGEDKDELREILLLYNIIIMYKAKGVGNRYNFLESNRKVWTREHIYPQSWKGNKKAQKEILKAITSNLDSKGNIILKKELILRYINLLFEKETIIKENNGVLKKCSECPVEPRDNPGIINFDKDKKVIKKFIEQYSNIEIKDMEDKYKYEYCKKLKLINNAYQLLEKIVVCEESEKINSCLKRNNDIVNYKNDIINHIKNNQDVFWKYNIDDYCSDINFDDKNLGEILIYIEDKIKMFEMISPQVLCKMTELNANLASVLSEKESSSLEIDKWNKKIKDCENQFKNIIRDMYHYTVENIDQIYLSNQLIELIFENCTNSINNDVSLFFEKEIDNLIEDNSIGNMTLLDNIVNGSSEIANNLFSEKRVNIYQKVKAGEFIPLVTILCFSDVYTKYKNSDNYWMFESRCEYLLDVLSTVQSFFEKENKIDKRN